MTLRRLALLALPIAALATACGDPDSVGTTPDTTIAGIEHPMGADEPILRLTVAGGFVPVESAFANVPQITIYGDGTVITPGVMTMIYPGPMVAPLNQRTISEEGIQRVLDAPTDYSEACLAFCDLAPRCHARALAADNGIVLGGEVARFLGDTTISRALELMAGVEAADDREADLQRQLVD